jgi:hypothetical protein
LVTFGPKASGFGGAAAGAALAAAEPAAAADAELAAELVDFAAELAGAPEAAAELLAPPPEGPQPNAITRAKPHPLEYRYRMARSIGAGA